MRSKLRFRCLVLDHDDTVMESTRCIHYPAFLQGMRKLRPEVDMSLEDFFRMNFHPGIETYYREVLRLSQEEYDWEFRFWQDYTRRHVPRVYPGMERIIRRQREGGGFVCVSSHSVAEQIRRDYAANALPAPELVYGWELPPERRKPAPFALEEIMTRLGLSREELVMVDDLRFGCDMAAGCGVTAVGAGWAHEIGEIREYMERHCDLYCDSPRMLEDFLFPG